MTDEKSIELMEENEKLREALSDLIYLCESSDKPIVCVKNFKESKEFAMRKTKLSENITDKIT